MTLDSSIRNTGATVAGTASLFACLFWMLDAGSVLLASGTGVATAMLPEGTALATRLLYTIVFAIAGAVAGIALMRSRAIETRAAGQLTLARSMQTQGDLLTQIVADTFA